MLPRLQAEEALQGVNVLHAGDSMISAGSRQRVIDAWQEQARPGDNRTRTVEDVARGLRAALGQL